MEVPLDLRSVVILTTLFLGIHGSDLKVAETSPRTVVMRKSFRYPDYNQMTNRGFQEEVPQYWDNQFVPTVEPHIDSLIKCTAYLIDTMHRLELKFDRVFDVVNIEENVAHDAMDKLRLIYQYIKGAPTNACKTDCSSSVNEIPQNHLMKELVDAVKYSNENIRKVVTNFDAVVESGRRSMQSLEEVVHTIQDINERTIRIQQTSAGQFSGGMTPLHRDGMVGTENPSIMNTRISHESNNYDGSNQNSPISLNQPTSSANYDSSDRKGSVNDNKSPSTKSSYDTTSAEVDNDWGRKSQVDVNGYGNKNGNSDRGRQSEIGRSTNYDANGRVISDSKSSVTSSISDYGSKQNQNSFTKSTHEMKDATSAEVDNDWGRKSQVDVNGYGNTNGNSDRGRQSGIGRSTNYDANGRVISDSKSLVTSSISDYGSNQKQNSFTKSTHEKKENQIVDHNRNNYQEKKKDGVVIDHNKVPIISTPSVPEVNSWNSHETFNGELNQNQKSGHITNDRSHTQDSYTSKGSGANLDSKSPNESSSRSTFESSAGETGSWNTNSHKSSSQEIKPGVARADNYDAIVNDIFDKNKITNKTNYESSGIVTQTQHSVANSSLKLNENIGEKVVVTQNSTSYGSNGSVVNNGHVNPVAISTKTTDEPSETEVRSHFQNTKSHSTSTVGTTEKEVIEQKTSIVAPTTSNDAYSTTSKSKEQSYGNSTHDSKTSGGRVTTTTTTSTTTTTTAKPQTTSTTANSQRTYRSLRKDAKRVTFEPGKRNCHELTVKRNGIYKFGSMEEIANDGDRFFYERYCDFYTDNRAWTVIQRRFADADFNEESFNRTWLDYKHGFGSLDDEFWFGNDFIHKLTFDDEVELRILIEDEDGETNWVQYSLFKMKSEKDNYKLVISGFSSDSVEDSLLYHNDQEFSTYDHRNGNNQQTSCASSMGNGWWFKNCSDKAILGNFLGSTSTKMMIRPKI